MHGRGAASITRILAEEKVLTPGGLNFQRYGTFANIYAGAPEEKAYAWAKAQVKSILKEETETGLSMPDIGLLEPHADALGVTVAELLCQTVPMKYGAGPDRSQSWR